MKRGYTIMADTKKEQLKWFKKLDQNTDEFRIMMFWWDILQNHYEVEDSDEYFESIDTHLKVLLDKYKDNPLTLPLTVCTLEWYETKWKNKYQR